MALYGWRAAEFSIKVSISLNFVIILIFPLRFLLLADIIKRYREEDHIQFKKQVRTPGIFNEKEERRIIRRIRENLHCNVPQLASEICHKTRAKTSTEAVRRIMKRNEFNGRVTRRNRNKQEKRLAFAKEFIKKSQINGMMLYSPTKVNIAFLVWIVFKSKNSKATLKHRRVSEI